MYAVRWTSNTVPDGPYPNAPFAAFAVGWLVSLVINLAAIFPASVFVPRVVQERMGWTWVLGSVVMLMVMPILGVCFVALFDGLARNGRFGLASSVLSAIGTVLGGLMVVTFITFGASSEVSNRELVTLLFYCLDFALGFGPLIGVIFWNRMARFSPRWFLNGPEEEVDGLFWPTMASFMVPLWHVAFWRLAGAL